VKAVFKLLGLGQRARSVVSGDEGVRTKLERHQARLVIVARDAAPATRRDFSLLAARYSVPCVEFGTKDELGAAVGKSPRAVLALLEDNLARRVMRLLEASEA
jgi:ribosomal protein L7Ae-like RNA K-turn-binding protein